MKGICGYFDKKNKRLPNSEIMKDHDGKEAIDNNSIDVMVMDEWSDITDEEGIAEFDVEYDDYTSTISKQGYATTSIDVQFREDQNTFPATVRKLPILTFTVLNNLNNPIENVSVGIGHSQAEIFGRTNSAGKVSFAIEYDTYSYAMSHDRYRVKRGSITFDEENTSSTEVMENLPILDFTVLNVMGDPLNNVLVRIRPEGSLVEYSGRTDVEGHAYLYVEHDTYEYTMTKDGYKVGRGSVKFNAWHDEFTTYLESETGHILTLNINDVKGEPWRGGRVEIVGKSGKGIYTESNEDGVARFDVPYGDYTVKISPSDYLSVSEDITFSEGQTTFNITLYKYEFTVEVTRTYATLCPADRVTIRNTESGKVDTVEGDGVKVHFVFRVPDGEYEVTAMKTGYQTQTIIHNFDSGHKSVRIELSPL